RMPELKFPPQFALSIYSRKQIIKRPLIVNKRFACSRVNGFCNDSPSSNIAVRINPALDQPANSPTQWYNNVEGGAFCFSGQTSRLLYCVINEVDNSSFPSNCILRSERRCWSRYEYQ
ncbi:MAG: hypothetical protein WCS94_19720, partial [Verrucomicrobiota bacterium]